MASASEETAIGDFFFMEKNSEETNVGDFIIPHVLEEMLKDPEEKSSIKMLICIPGFEIITVFDVKFNEKTWKAYLKKKVSNHKDTNFHRNLQRDDLKLFEDGKWTDLQSLKSEHARIVIARITLETPPSPA